MVGISRAGNFEFAYMSDDNSFAIIIMGQIKIAMDDGGARTLNDVTF